MSDCDQAQLATLQIVYPQSQIFLCKWHVLRAMRSHFVTDQFQALWDKIKAWVNTDDLNEFLTLWDEISSDPSVPESVVKYLTIEWMQMSHMWSNVEGDTNMLIEAYHHVLKSHWLDGKRNRHIDCIIYTLVNYMVPYYQTWHMRQVVGLEGPDLAGERRRDILTSTKEISHDSIQQFDDTQFHVASQSRPGQYYAIDLCQSTCDCRDFPRIRFCKHIAAVYVYFPHLCPEESTPTVDPEAVQDPDQPQCNFRTEDSLRTLTQDIHILSNQLTSKIGQSLAPSLAVLEAVRSAKYTLTAAIASSQGTSALPHKNFIAPNQKSWMEMAKRMGIKKAPKHQRLPKEHGLMERSIGVAKTKK
ncbi:hypothetical protein BJV78DRAFT_1153479 [Lactifluus subvellereus]|nr:hypothetical protein BJV78DRAFT_1153479 [Lactifluus subvellereus]